MRASVSPAWQRWLDRLEATGAAAPSAAARARMTRIRRFAADTGGDPADVTPADVASWLQSLGAAPDAVKKYRHAARALYNWAIREQLIDTNPVSAVLATRYTTDAQWSDALSQFEKQQAGDGIGAGTVAVRVGHVRRFARDSGATPWSATHADYAGWIAGLNVADNTRAKMRDSLRAFYRWGHKRGRIDEDPTAEPARRASTPPVPNMWEPHIRTWRSWLRSAGHPEATVRLRLVQLRRFARDHESLEPWDVTVDELIDWMSGQRWASETRRSYRSALRSFYRWACETGRIDEDPTDRLPAIRMAKPQPKPALEEEYARALRSADEGERLALRLAGEMGLRCAEVCQVHTRDIRLTDNGWTLVVHGKGSKERTLPMPDHLANLARARQGWVFPGGDRGHISAIWMSKRISRLLPEGVTMHALRHRFATRAYNVDRDVFTVQQLLGHASPATTQRYVLVNDHAKRKIIDAVAGPA